MCPKNITDTSALLSDFIEVGWWWKAHNGERGKRWKWGMDTRSNGTVSPLILIQRGLAQSPHLSFSAVPSCRRAFSKYVWEVIKRIMRTNMAWLGLEQTDLLLSLPTTTQRSTTDTSALDFVLPSYQRTPLAWHLQRGSANTGNSVLQACGLKTETEL